MFPLNVYSYMCAPCLQKKVSDALELELQMPVNCHVGARSLTRIP